MTNVSDALLNEAIAIARGAGELILEVYHSDVEVYEKQDHSPVTQADLLAHQYIVGKLAQLTPQLPILSEESAKIPWAQRQNWDEYWLVDPLDGTKEFIKQNGEFTVNIALIVAGIPVLGVVYAPAMDTLYFAAQGLGAYKRCQKSAMTKITVASKQPAEKWRVVGSRSHANQETQDYLNALDAPYEFVEMGSSLKICLVADGTAHLYPRLGLTSEWDTAAAHAVVLEAGGSIQHLDGKGLIYNQKESLLNPHFVVC